MTSSERRRGEQRGLSPAATPSPSYGLLLPEEGTVAGDDEPILARAFAALDCEKLDIGEVVTFKTDELAVEVDLDPVVVVLLGRLAGGFGRALSRLSLDRAGAPSRPSRVTIASPHTLTKR